MQTELGRALAVCADPRTLEALARLLAEAGYGPVAEAHDVDSALAALLELLHLPLRPAKGARCQIQPPPQIPRPGDSQA